MDSNSPTVAILGTSVDRAKFGKQAVRAHLRAGWTVRSVNSKETAIQGVPCFAAHAQTPGRPLRVSVCLPPAVLWHMLPDIARKGCEELWLNPGADSSEVETEAQRLGRREVAVRVARSRELGRDGLNCNRDGLPHYAWP